MTTRPTDGSITLTDPVIDALVGKVHKYLATYVDADFDEMAASFLRVKAQARGLQLAYITSGRASAPWANMGNTESSASSLLGDMQGSQLAIEFVQDLEWSLLQWMRRMQSPLDRQLGLVDVIVTDTLNLEDRVSGATTKQFDFATRPIGSREDRARKLTDLLDAALDAALNEGGTTGA